MKKVLLIAYHFPPEGGAGVQRPLKFAKYLSAFGWQPFILTVNHREAALSDQSLLKDLPAETRIMRTHHYDLAVKRGYHEKGPQNERKGHSTKNNSKLGHFFSQMRRALLTPLRFILTVPDYHMGWNPYLFAKAFSVIKKEKIDMIFITGDPFSSFLVGPFLKLLTGKPYVIDFRDEWVDYWIQSGGPVGQKGIVTPFRFAVEKRMEAFVVRHASRVIAVTSAVLENFRKRYARENQNKFVCITNGYDTEDFESSNIQPPATENPRLILTYSGGIHSRINIEPLLKATSALASSNLIKKEDLVIRFVGRVSQSMEHIFKRYALSNIERIPYVPHQECVKYMQQSHVLLLFLGQYYGVERILPGKIFEYFAARKPILAIMPDGEVQRLIENHCRGKHIQNDRVDEIKEYLLALLAHYKKHGSVADLYDTSILDQYTRKNLTAKLATVFDEILDGKTIPLIRTNANGNAGGNRKKRPEVSVVIPTHNRPDLLKKAIRSVLAQTFKDYELIVVDNGDNPLTISVVETFQNQYGPIQYVTEKVPGPGATRNRGLREITGNYVAFLDDDDSWDEIFLETSIRHLQDNRHLAFVSSRMRVRNEAGQITGQKPKNKAPICDFEHLLDEDYVITSTVVAKAASIEAAGGFDASLPNSQDYDLWLRIAAKQPFDVLEAELGNYLVHSVQVTKNIERCLLNHVKIYKKAARYSHRKKLQKKARHLISTTWYRLARYQKEKGHYRKAVRSILHSIGTNPSVGHILFSQQNPSRHVLRPEAYLACLKPYAALFVCLFKGIREASS